MGYKREVKISLDIDEIRTICESLRQFKNSYTNELKTITTKNGRARKGSLRNKEFLLKEVSNAEKLYKFFNNLF